jgi:hypothetical protein
MAAQAAKLALQKVGFLQQAVIASQGSKFNLTVMEVGSLRARLARRRE